MRSLKPVRYGPGLSSVTSTPCAASSARMALPIASSACLVIEYGPNAGPDTTPAIDDTMMIRPAPLATMRGNDAAG